MRTKGTPSFRILGLISALSFAFCLPGSVHAETESDAADQDEEDRVDTIVVTGQQLPDIYAGGQVATGAQLGVLGNRSVLDTPFNIQSYTNQSITDSQARSIADVLDNDPATRATWSPAAGYTYEEYTIRGLLVNTQDVTLNGLQGMWLTGSMPGEALERVEILKGPSAMLNGVALHGSLGGNVNAVSKRAGNDAVTSLTTSYDSESLIGQHVDLGRRLGAQDQFGVRFNGVYRNGDTAIDGQSLKLGFAAIALDYRGQSTRLLLDAGYHERERDVPLMQIPVIPGFAMPEPPKAGSNFQQAWAFSDSNDKYAMIRAERDIAPDWLLFASLGDKSTEIDALVALDTLANSQGDTNLVAGYIPRTFDTTSGEVGLRGRFFTGAAKHEVSVVLSAIEQDAGAFNSFAFGGVSNLYQPVQIPLPPGINTQGTPSLNSSNARTSVALADTVTLLENRLQLTVGARLQNVTVKAYTPDGNSSTVYDEDKITPVFGIVIKPSPNSSVFANYIEGLTQPRPPGQAMNSAEVFPPMRTRQAELGAKYDWGSLQAGVSVFNITQPKTVIDPSTLIYSVDGEQRVRGIDLNLSGVITDQVRILGGLTLLDGEQTKTANGVNQGNDTVGTPRAQLNVGTDVDVRSVPGLSLNARVLYTGEQAVDVGNTQTIPDWTRFDLGARYRITFREIDITIRGNVENLSNRSYWASTARDLTLGAPRTYKLSLTLSF